MIHQYHSGHIFQDCPFCGTTPRYLPHQAGYHTERVICDPCGFHLSPEKWEDRRKMDMTITFAKEELLGRDVHLVQPGGSSEGSGDWGRILEDVLEATVMNECPPFQIPPEEGADPLGRSVQANNLDIMKNGTPQDTASGQITTDTTNGWYDPVAPTKSIEEVLREWRDNTGYSRDAPPQSKAGDLVRHVKSGGIYQVIVRAKLESDLTEVVVYRSTGTGIVWVRSLAEFNDGRFVPHLDGPFYVPSPPPPAPRPSRNQCYPPSAAILPLAEMTEEDLMTGDRAFLFGSVRRGNLGWSEPTWHQVFRMYTARPLSDSNNWVTSGGPGENSYIDNRFTHFLRINPQPKKEDTSGSTTHVLAPSVRIQGGWQSENEEAAQRRRAQSGTSA